MEENKLPTEIKLIISFDKDVMDLLTSIDSKLWPQVEMSNDNIKIDPPIQEDQKIFYKISYRIDTWNYLENEYSWSNVSFVQDQNWLDKLFTSFEEAQNYIDQNDLGSKHARILPINL